MRNRAVKVLSNIMPEPFSYDEAEVQQWRERRQEPEAQEALLWTPLQVVLLTCWRSPRDLKQLESQEKVEERFLQFDSLEKHSPEYFATQVEQCLMELKPEEPDSWPHKLVLAQWIALADKWGFAQAMDDDFPSLFVKETSAWQAAYKTMLEAKAFREQWWDLLGYVHQEQAARILAYHPWRP